MSRIFCTGMALSFVLDEARSTDPTNWVSAPYLIASRLGDVDSAPPLLFTGTVLEMRIDALADELRINEVGASAKRVAATRVASQSKPDLP